MCTRIEECLQFSFPVKEICKICSDMKEHDGGILYLGRFQLLANFFYREKVRLSAPSQERGAIVATYLPQ